MQSTSLESKDPTIDLSPINKVLDTFKGSSLAVIPLLQRTQDHYGYIPRPVLVELSRRTRIPLSRLYGVATFYAQFRLSPRGRHLVRICDGTACHVRGAPRNIQAIRQELHLEPGQTTPDHKLSLEIVYCLGSCGLAPVAVVDQRVCGRLAPDQMLSQLSNLE